MTQTKLNKMKNKLIKLIFVLCLTILFFSCQSKTEKRLIGSWALELDSCVVLNRNWHTETCSNTMAIRQNQECDLPLICGQSIQQALGTWQLASGKNVPDTILFNVPDNPLRGKYMITFYKDYNAMKFKMKLQNDSTILICSKFVVSFKYSQKDLLDRQ